MSLTKDLFKASLGLRSLLSVPMSKGATKAPAVIPVRPVGIGERDHIARHLLDLDATDRYLRFGFAASDEQVQRYVDGLNFERDELFGIYNRKLELIAMAHLAFAPNDVDPGCAEFGVSVSKHARGRGYGGLLFQSASTHARNAGVSMLFIHALSENVAMLKIARKAGASVVRSGSESEAHLQLPLATFDSHMSQIVESHYAEVDYRIKARAKQFWAFLAGVQEIRSGIRDARSKSSQ